MRWHEWEIHFGFVNSGFCKCYIWPEVSKLFLCFIQTACLFQYTLITNHVQRFQQNRSEVRTCALPLALAFTHMQHFQPEVRRSKEIDWHGHFVPCSLSAPAARQCEFKYLEHSPHGETRGWVEWSDLMKIAVALSWLFFPLHSSRDTGVNMHCHLSLIATREM